MGLSRSEDILEATINGDEYDQPPQSRIEKLLIDLKDTISGGGGGSGVIHTAINPEDTSALPEGSIWIETE